MCSNVGSPHAEFRLILQGKKRLTGADRGQLRPIEVTTVFGLLLDAEKLAETQDLTNIETVHALSSRKGCRALLFKTYGCLGLTTFLRSELVLGVLVSKRA